MQKTVWTLLKRFRKNERGVAAVEFVLVFPILLVMIMGSVFAFFTYQGSKMNERASSVASDLVTRLRTDLRTSDFVLINATARSIATKYARDNSYEMEIASIENPIGRGNWLRVGWSMPSGSITRVPRGLPSIADGDSVIFVRVKSAYEPIFASNFTGPMTYENVTIRRPRFQRIIAGP